MSDAKQLLEPALETATHVALPTDEFDRFLRYGERRRRNQRLAAGAVALGLALAVAGALLSVARSPERIQPANDGIVLNPPADSGPCFVGEACWDMDVYVVAADGTGATPLGYEDQRDLAYSWSSDGERIAFFVGEGVDGVEGYDETSASVYTMAADGTDVRRLTEGGGQWIAAAWSPDGSRIIYNDAGLTQSSG